MSMTCLPIQGGIDHYRICEQSVLKAGAGWLPVMIRGDIGSQSREHWGKRPKTSMIRRVVWMGE